MHQHDDGVKRTFLTGYWLLRTPCPRQLLLHCSTTVRPVHILRHFLHPVDRMHQHDGGVVIK
jgi:hypothetical protein